MREISRRGTCSPLDLKSVLGLSLEYIMEITARLADRRSVRIKKDHQGGHISYTWTGPKEEAPGGKSSPAKKPPPSLPDSAPPVQASVSGVASPRASRAKKFSEPLPADWKQCLERSISSWSHHPTEKELMLQLLRKKEVKEAASLIWKASRKVNPKWDASLFLERIQDMLFLLAVYFGLPRLTAKALQARVEILEKLREDRPFFREGPAREELEREISTYKNQAKNTSKTKPKDLGKRGALQFLRQYFQEYFQKPLDPATALLISAAFKVKWTASTVRTRVSELATYGLTKATAANTTKEAFAAIDKLEWEELEAAMAKMAPRLLRRYLQSEGWSKNVTLSLVDSVTY
jgi:hypothetical protein